MLKKCLWVFTILLCMIVGLSACKPAEPVDNQLTTPTPNVSASPTQPETETPDTAEPVATTPPMESATPGKTPTKAPGATPDKTTGNKPTKTPTQGTAKPTETPKSTTYTLPYVLYVNRMANVVTVYTADKKGNPVTPIKAMLCSTGRNNGTPTGTFAISEKYTWRPLFGNVYGQYACRFNGSILFHSVPYLKTNKGTLKPGEFNKLGTQASDGCVRLAVADCKWIYDNCKTGTKVVVYDSADPGPLGKPTGLIIPEDAGWDPTDPDANNPWKKQMPVMPVTFSGVPATAVELQRNAALPDLLANVMATDALGRDVTSYIKVNHAVNMQQVGSYTVQYQVTDQTGTITNIANVIYRVVDGTAPVVNGLVTSHEIAEADIQTMTKVKLLQGVSIVDDGDSLKKSAVQLTLHGQTYAPQLLVVGENTILLQINDGNGNVTEMTITVVVTGQTTTPEPTETPEPTDETELPDETEMPTETETPINM